MHINQGGGIPLQSVLQAVTVVKILTKKIIMALHIFAIVRSITEILLDLDQLDHVYQRDIVA